MRLSKDSDLAAISGTCTSNTKESNQISILCYAFTAGEPTIPALSKNLHQACDAVALFGFQNDATLGVNKAYSVEQSRQDFNTGTMHNMILAAYERFDSQGWLDKCTWIVKVDADTFIRPSALRPTLAQYTSSAQSVISTPDGSSTPDGFFLAAPARIAQLLYRTAVTSNICDVLLGGHNSNKTFDEIQASDTCLERNGLSKMIALNNGKQEHLVLNRIDSPLLSVDQIARNWVAVHPVKSLSEFEHLMHKFQ